LPLILLDIPLLFGFIALRHLGRELIEVVRDVLILFLDDLGDLSQDGGDAITNIHGTMEVGFDVTQHGKQPVVCGGREVFAGIIDPAYLVVGAASERIGILFDRVGGIVNISNDKLDDITHGATPL